MRLSQVEVVDAYASDVTRLHSFRGYGGGLSTFTDQPRDFEDLQDESSLHRFVLRPLLSLLLFRLLHRLRRSCGGH